MAVAKDGHTPHFEDTSWLAGDEREGAGGSLKSGLRFRVTPSDPCVAGAS